MMDNNTDFSWTSTGQLVISRELVLLIRWLMEHQSDTLKKIVKKAVAHNGHHDDHAQENHTFENSLDSADEMNQQLNDFFIMLESFLEEALNEQLLKTARAKNLMPTIDHLDSSLYDSETVRTSLEKVTKKMVSNPTSNPKEQLFEELLKQWKPHTKNNMN